MKTKKLKVVDVTICIVTATFLLMTGIFIACKNMNFSKQKQVPVMTYNTKDNVSYKLLLTPNTYYPEEIEEDNKLIDSIPYQLIDKIRTNFTYNLNASTLFNYSYKYKIVANVLALQSLGGSETKKVFNKDFVLLEEKEVTDKNKNKISIDESIDIDYQQFNDYLKEYRKQYPLSLTSSLTIKLVVDVEGNCDDTEEKVSEQKEISLLIPLLEQTVSVTKNIPEESNKTLLSSIITNVITNYTWFSIGIIFTILSIILAIPSLLAIKTVRKENKYLRTVKKYIKDYDEIMVESSIIVDLIDKNIIEVTNFNDLLDAQQELHIPIIYNEIEYNKEVWFTITNGIEVWRYIFKNEE